MGSKDSEKTTAIVLSHDVPTSIMPLTGSDMMLKPVGEMSNGEAAQAHLALKLVQEMLKERLDTIREKLLETALVNGDKTDKGGHRYDFDGMRVLREKRVEHNLKVDKVVELLKTKALAILDGCDEVKQFVVNPSKVKHLIDTGKLTQKDIDGITTETIALKVFPSDEMATILEAAREAYAMASSDAIPPLIVGEKVKAVRKK